MVRQDPDVIVVGEIRDRFSADTCMHAALTGHKVMTTIHNEDSIGGLIPPPQHGHRGFHDFVDAGLRSGPTARTACVPSLCRTRRTETRGTAQDRIRHARPQGCLAPGGTRMLPMQLHGLQGTVGRLRRFSFSTRCSRTGFSAKEPLMKSASSASRLRGWSPRSRMASPRRPRGKPPSARC